MQKLEKLCSGRPAQAKGWASVCYFLRYSHISFSQVQSGASSSGRAQLPRLLPVISWKHRGGSGESERNSSKKWLKSIQVWNSWMNANYGPSRIVWLLSTWYCLAALFSYWLQNVQGISSIFRDESQVFVDVFTFGLSFLNPLQSLAVSLHPNH